VAAAAGDAEMTRAYRMRALILSIIVVAVTQAACSRAVHQKDFASAEDAVQALVTAARSDDMRALLEVLGPDAEPTIDSGDPVADKNARTRFVQAYETEHALDADAEGMTTLQVGVDKWPFPFPLVQRDKRWRFDSPGGAEEVINRRVGRNELYTIQSCLAFVDAEREYYSSNPQQEPMLHYAQKLQSSDGKKDGLYWPAAGDEPQSPLGEQFARARSEGYFKEAASDSIHSAPFHGYVYRLLTAQGPNAPGGAYDYLVAGKMIGGFALIAFPAEYGNSGVMTFIVNHEGVVYSKDLGPETPAAANAIAAFDPDGSWKREAGMQP
jgi:Protein of unknown function (DUF2950).